MIGGISPMQENRQKLIIRTSIIGILVNVLLAAGKAAVGLLSHSIAIVLDAVNNLSDALSSVITIIGARLAGKPADKDHPFGHGRYEYLSAAIISAIVLYAGITSFIESAKKIIHPETPDYSPVTLIIVASAVVVKLLLGRYVKSMGQKLNSDSLVNSGEDARLDSVISASTLVAAAIYIFTRISLEAWLGLAIAAFIIKSGVDMLRETISKILGERAEPEVSKEIRSIVLETEEILGAYDLALTSYGPDRWLASVHVEVPDTTTADRIDEFSREIAGKVYDRTGVIMSAVGIYSRNTTSDEAKAIRSRVTEIVMSHEFILQIHAFYCDLEKKALRFDAVIDFAAPDPNALCAQIRKEIQAEYPDFQITIQADRDLSD